MQLKKPSLKINAVLNVVKQCCMIIYPMITFPYASRVLGAENYGKINFSNSIISYISLLAGLGITNYAIREGAQIRSEKNKLQSFINEVFSLNLCSTIFAYLCLVVLVLFWPKMESYVSVIWIQSFVVLFTTLGMDWINSLYEDYLYITLRYILCQGLAIILMFLLVKGSDDYIWYAFSSMIGTVIANIMNMIHIYKTWGVFPKFRWSASMIRHLKAIMIMFGSSIASLIYINSDITILGIMTNDTVVGYYSVSSKVYTLVKQLMNALLIVAIPRIANELTDNNDEKITYRLNQIFQYLILLVLPAAMGLGVLYKNIILLLAGQEYIRSASSLKILSLALVFATLACFYINVIMLPFRMEAKILKATIISAGLNIILNLILIPFGQENSAAFTTLISEIVMFLLGMWYVKGKFKAQIKRVLIISILGMIWIQISYPVVKKVTEYNSIVIFSTIIVSCIGYVILLAICFKRAIKRKLITLNKRKIKRII